MDKYQQFLNFIRQNWIVIVLNIALAVICVWSIRYGLSRPFNPKAFGCVVAAGIIIIASSIADARGNVNIMGDVYVWGPYKKYHPPIILIIVTLTVLLASSFQNVDARSWKFDRGTGKLVTQAVFILPGSTLEKEYFVVDRKLQKEVSVWIWFPAVEDSGWSYEREPYSFRKKVILICNFKNHKAYERIQGTQFPEIPILATSRAQGPEAVRLTVLMYSGLTSEDVEINKIDGLE